MHIKASATEMLQLIMILDVFCYLVLVPDDLLKEEAACFKLLTRIIGRLRAGDNSTGRLDLPSSLILKHHKAYLVLYPTCRNQKMYYLMHTVDCWRRFGVNLSCFAMERKHRLTKRIANCCFNHMRKSLSVRSLRRSLADLRNPVCFQSYAFLSEAAIPVALRKILALTCPPEAASRPGKVAHAIAFAYQHLGFTYSADALLWSDMRPRPTCHTASAGTGCIMAWRAAESRSTRSAN